MARLYTTTLLAAFALLGCIHFVKGLKCHYCYNERTAGDVEDGYPACSLGGKALGDSFLVECSYNNEITAEMVMGMIKPNSTSYSRRSNEEPRSIHQANTKYLCAAIVADAFLEDNNAKTNFVMRGCLAPQTFSVVGDFCFGGYNDEKTVAEWRSNVDDEWSQIVSDYAHGLTSSSKVKACTCSADGCNSATFLAVPIKILFLSAIIAMMTNISF